MTEINSGYEITLFHAIIYRRIRTNALTLFIAVRSLNPISLFFAGTIDMGGVDWQKAHVVSTEGSLCSLILSYYSKDLFRLHWFFAIIG